jgi:hypothetical protein
MLWKRIIMVLTVLLWAGAAFADVTIKKQEGGFEETAYYKGAKIAMVSDDGREIIDGAAKTITIVNPDAGVYTQASLKEYKNVMLDHFKRMGEMQVEMMMAATGLGRAEAEAMIKQQVAAMAPKSQDVKVEKGDTKDIAGYPSEQYRFIVDGTMVREVWISPAVDALIAKEMGAGVKKALDAAFREMEDGFTDAVKGFSGYDSALENAVNEVAAKGYLMRDEDRITGLYGDREPVKIDISTDPVDPSVFKVPAGYEKISMAQFLEKEMMEMDADDYDDEDDD